MLKKTKRPEPLDIALAKRIHKRRVEIGMTQETLADRVGLSFQQIQKYERGGNRLTVGRAMQIALVLGTTLARLIDGLDEGSAHRETKTLAILSNPHARSVAEAYARIKEQKISASVLRLIKLLAERGG